MRCGHSFRCPRCLPEMTECTQTNPFSFRTALLGAFAAIVCFLLLISATTTLNHDSVTSCVDHLGHSIHWVTQSFEMLTQMSCTDENPTDTDITTKLTRKKINFKNCFCEGMHLHGCIYVGARGSQKRVTGYLPHMGAENQTWDLWQRSMHFLSLGRLSSWRIIFNTGDCQVSVTDASVLKSSSCMRTW